MKKQLLSILLLIFSFATVKAQTPFPNTIGRLNPKTLDSVASAIRVPLGFINNVWADTTAANVNPYLKYYNGATIYTSTGGLKTWGRYNNTWVLQSGGGSGSGTVTSVSGLSPLFSVANPTTTPTFSLLNVNPYKLFGRASGTGVPSYLSIDTNFITGFSTYVRPLLSAGAGISYNSTTGAITNTNPSADTSFFRNPLTGDTLLSELTPNHFLFKSLVVQSPLVSAPTDTTVALSITQSGTGSDGYLSSTDWNTFNSKQSAINLVVNRTTGPATFVSSTLNIPDYSENTIRIGTFDSTTFPSTTLPSTFNKVGFFYSQNNGITTTAGVGTTNYYANYIQGNYGSASQNFVVSEEFTVKAKPSANTEGNWIGRLSANSFARLSLTCRPYWVDATHWTIGLYWLSGFTETLIDLPLFSANIALNTNDKYRMELSFVYPNVLAKLSRIDSTKSPYQDELESVSVLYTYGAILSSQPIIPNTGSYALGVTGTGTPTGSYYIDKFTSTLNDVTGCDMLGMGNSIMTGYNTSSTEYRFMNRLFQNSLRRYTVFAGPSDRTEDMLLRLNEMWLLNPHYILWEVGWNDIGSSAGSAVFSANLTKLIDSAKAHGITGQAVLRLPQTLFGYDTAFINVCQRENIPLIDMGQLLGGNLDGLGIHPNDYGNQLIANKVQTDLPSVFGQPNPIAYAKNNNVSYKSFASNGTTVDYVNNYFVDASGSNISITLFTTDQTFVAKKVDFIRTDNSSNTITLLTFGGTTINGGTSLQICPKQYNKVTIVQVDATSWVVDTLANPITTVALSNITAATGSNSISNVDYTQTWNWNGALGAGPLGGLVLNSTTTTAQASSNVLYVAASGANGSSSTGTLAAQFVNSHTGTTSTNIAAQFTASGGTNNYAIIVPASSGSVGINTSTPTAKLHIGAGTATASTAPLKFTTGTVMTTPEAGALEYNSGLLMLDSSNSVRDTIATRSWARNNISGGSGANTALSNLASVSINASLIPQSGKDLGAAATAWKDIYLYGSGTFGSHSLKLTGTPTGNRTITIPDATTTMVGTDATQTLTNKRWTARVGSTTSSATPTINTDNTDIYKLTAQTADITSFTTNLSGTPVDGDILEIQVTGTAARAITWGASFVSSTVTLPTTTVTTATLTVVFQYYTTSSYGNNKWVIANYY